MTLSRAIHDSRSVFEQAVVTDRSGQIKCHPAVAWQIWGGADLLLITASPRGQRGQTNLEELYFRPALWRTGGVVDKGVWCILSQRELFIRVNCCWLSVIVEQKPIVATSPYCWFTFDRAQHNALVKQSTGVISRILKQQNSTLCFIYTYVSMSLSQLQFILFTSRNLR